MFEYWLKQSLNFHNARSSFAAEPKAPQPERLLLQGADEALDAPVTLRLAHEGRARLDTDGAHFVREGVGDELAGLVRAERHACGDAGLVDGLGDPDILSKALDGLVLLPQFGDRLLGGGAVPLPVQTHQAETALGPLGRKSL
jgi:hypothetical protein